MPLGRHPARGKALCRALTRPLEGQKRQADFTILNLINGRVGFVEINGQKLDAAREHLVDNLQMVS